MHPSSVTPSFDATILLLSTSPELSVTFLLMQFAMKIEAENRLPA
jgi:hypothetical protein